MAIALLLVFNLRRSRRNFATVTNLRLQLVQVAPVAIVAIGMALVIATEGIDLSVGSTMAISAALLPLYIGYGVWPAIAIALAGRRRGRPGQRFARGVRRHAADHRDARPARGRPRAGAGVRRRTADRDCSTRPSTRSATRRCSASRSASCSCWWSPPRPGSRSAGPRSAGACSRSVGNRAAATLAGLPVKRTLVTVYVVSGVLAAVAGVLSTARQGASDPSFVGLLIELSAITAVVVGGTPLSGGRVRILGTLMGALLMQLITATVIQQNLPDSTARMIQARRFRRSSLIGSDANPSSFPT